MPLSQAVTDGRVPALIMPDQRRYVVWRLVGRRAVGADPGDLLDACWQSSLFDWRQLAAPARQRRRHQIARLRLRRI